MKVNSRYVEGMLDAALTKNQREYGYDLVEVGGLLILKKGEHVLRTFPPFPSGGVSVGDVRASAELCMDYDETVCLALSERAYLIEIPKEEGK